MGILADARKSGTGVGGRGASTRGGQDFCQMTEEEMSSGPQLRSGRSWR